MAHAQQTVSVPRPIHEVFAFLADGTNNPRWRPDVTTIRHVAGEGSGATYAQSMNGPGGRTIDGDYRIVRYEEPTRLDFEVIAGPARPTGSFVLRAIDEDSTELSFSIDLKPRGLMILMTPMINRQVKSEVANIANVPSAMAR